MAPGEGIDEQLARRLTRALSNDMLVDDWQSMSDRAAHAIGRDARSGAPRMVDVLLDGCPSSERDAFKRTTDRALGLAERLNHPNILTVTAAGMAGSWPYALSGAVDGRRLDEMLDSGARLDSGDVVRILHGIASALAHAHGEGLAHGRVSPHHVLVDRKSRNALLTDFGADGASASNDLSQFGRLAAALTKGATAQPWLGEIVEKTSRGGFNSAREIADAFGRHTDAPAKTTEASSAPAANEVTLNAAYVLARAAALHQRVTGNVVSATKALEAFKSMNSAATVEALDSAAFEAEIERRFVLLAAAENVTKSMGESVIAARIIDASVQDVLSGVSRLKAPNVGLSLVNTVCGQATDGGIMVFDIPQGHAAWKSTSGTLGARQVMVSVTRASNGRDPRVSNVLMSAVIDPRRATTGSSGAAIGGGVGGVILGGAAGAMFGVIGAVAGAVVAGVIGAAGGASYGKSGAANTMKVAEREMAVAIDAISG